MFEIPDDDDNFWETLPIEDITNINNTKHHHLKFVSDDPDKRHLENDRSVLHPDSYEYIDVSVQSDINNKSLESICPSRHGPKTSKSIQLNQDSFQSPSFSPLVFSIAHSDFNVIGKETSKKKENSNVSRVNTQGSLENISHIPADSVQNGSKYEILIGNELRPIDRYTPSHSSSFNSKHHSEINSSVQTRHSSSSNSTHHSEINSSMQTRPVEQRCTGQSSPVTPLQKQSKRPWNHEDVSPPLDDARPKRSRRKFPGPAGVLPKLRPGSKIEEIVIVSTSDQVKLPEETILSSQSADDLFNDNPWHRLLHDLGADADEILKRFSIVSSLQKAIKKQLPQGKVPLLFAAVESLDVQGTDASVMLKDKSGKIQGTFHRDLVKEYASCLQAGVVVVLRQVGVISPTSRSHYLNITPNNIVSIYMHHTGNTESIKHFPNTSPHNLKELVTVSDLQIQKQASSTPRRNQSGQNNVGEGVSTNNIRTNELLRKNPIVNQEKKIKLNQECSRFEHNVSTPDVRNSVLMTNSSPDATTRAPDRSCQLQSLNGMTTPVRKFSFKPSGNSTPFKQSGITTPFKSRENSTFNPSGITTPFKSRENSTPSKQSEITTPFKPSGNSTPFKPSENSIFFKSGGITPFRENENTTNCLKTTRNGQVSDRSIATMEHCSANLNTLAKDFNSTEQKQYYTDFNFNKTEIKHPQTSMNITSSIQFCSLHHQNESGVKQAEQRVESSSKEWDDGDWQSTELDELLSQMSEDM